MRDYLAEGIGPEDQLRYELPEINLVCDPCNLGYWPNFEGWRCPLCGGTGEFEHIEIEQCDYLEGFVAFARNWNGEDYGIFGKGATPEEAVDGLYQEARRVVHFRRQFAGKNGEAGRVGHDR